MIQAIFFDIDGTLVDFNTHEVSDQTFETLWKLKNNGIRLFIATGRGKDGLAVLEDFPFDGFITLNGQYCYTQDGTVVYENTISKEAIEKILAYESKHHFPCGFVKENEKIFNYRDERVDEIHAITHNDNHPSGDVSNIMNEKVYQIMAFVTPEEEAELMKNVEHCTTARWYPTFCDISPLGGTKVKGIDTFLQYYNIPLTDTLSFGDGGNDIPMLRHTAFSVAMGNASEEVKRAASFVSEDTAHEGITAACKKLNLI